VSRDLDYAAVFRKDTAVEKYDSVVFAPDSYATAVNRRQRAYLRGLVKTAFPERRPIQYDFGFTLLPAKYTIKFLARDAETGRIGTYQAPFTVPNLNKELQRVPISTVVLSTQRVPLSDALYSVKQKVAAEAANPLVHDGQKLVPSVTRVFSKGRDLYVFAQTYQRGSTTTQPLVAFVSFYRGEVKAFETAPIMVTEGLDAKTKAVPLRFSVPLEGFATGRYDCQVTVIDPTGAKIAFWRAPIVIVR